MRRRLLLGIPSKKGQFGFLGRRGRDGELVKKLAETALIRVAMSALTRDSSVAPRVGDDVNRARTRNQSALGARPAVCTIP